MTASSRIEHVLIAGGGTAGWMTAAALAKFVAPTGVSITLVESDAIGTVGVGEATIPNIADFNAMLGIEEHDFLAATNGSYKLGIEFVDWGRKGDRYFHPFGTHGFDMQGVPFHQYWLRLRAAGDDHSIDAYSMCATAGRAGKFLQPHSDPESPLSQMRHAYHFDASRYAAFLRSFAEERGVVRREGRIADVQTEGERGHVRSISLESGETLSADLFVDCTGFRALLIGQTLGVDYTDWTHWLPCDRAIAVPSARVSDPIPYTRATAREAGWQWRIPLQHRTGNGHVFSSGFTDEDTALQRLMSTIEGTALASPNHLRFSTGRRERFWEKNCVAIGLSSGFLEPLESTSIHLIQEGVSKLIALFPDKSFDQREIAAYNSILGKSYDYIRDFIILHYKATQRDDTPFWNHVRTMDVPDTLTEILDLFRHRGRFFGHKQDLFTITSWIAVMIGQNILPDDHDPVADCLPLDQVRATLADMRHVYGEAARRMPPHAAYLEKFCPARIAEEA